MKPTLQHAHKGDFSSAAVSGAMDTGSLEDGLCYLVTLSLSGALTEEERRSYDLKRKEWMERLSEAGLRSARSKMKECASGLEMLFIEEVEPLLNLNRGEGNLLPLRNEIAALLQETEGCYPIELSIRPNHLHFLLRWSGNSALAACMEDWKAHFSGTPWAEGFYCLQVDESRVELYRGLVRADQSDETDLLTRQAAAAPEASIPDFHHVTVLLHEAVDILQPGPGKVIVDATLGGGGHSELLLERGATVIGIDQDPEARLAAAARLARFGDRFKILSGNFRNVASLLRHEGITRIDGLLADIGVSSHQIDTAERGFSFRENGPLDMRMSPEIPVSAADLVNTAEEAELARIFWEYGEERASRSFARTIVQAREQAPISTTAQLAALAERAIPRRSGHHPGTKSFQALRIAVNDELGALNDLLDASVSLLAENGILALITFHSLEDRCVKRFLDSRSKEEIDRPEWPAPRPNPEHYFRLLTKRPVTAGEQELKANPRSRSAKLRAAQRTSLITLPS